MLVVVISGPIASGKSTLGRAVAARLEEVRGTASAVVDLDLIYEMLDPRRRPKSDEHLWTRARRIGGRLASDLLHDGCAVVVEGDLASDDALREFETELPRHASPWLVMLNVDLETALERVEADPTRGISREVTFLSRHYDAFEPGWKGRRVLDLDAGSTSVSNAAHAVVAWVTERER